MVVAFASLEFICRRKSIFFFEVENRNPKSVSGSGSANVERGKWKRKGMWNRSEWKRK